MQNVYDYTALAIVGCIALTMFLGAFGMYCLKKSPRSPTAAKVLTANSALLLAATVIAVVREWGVINWLSGTCFIVCVLVGWILWMNWRDLRSYKVQQSAADAG